MIDVKALGITRGTIGVRSNCDVWANQTFKKDYLRWLPAEMIIYGYTELNLPDLMSGEIAPLII